MANAGYNSLHSDHELSDLNGGTEPGKGTTRGELSLKAPVLRWWAYEVAMGSLALVAFLSLVIVLAVEDGTPSRKFGPLTLNAVDTILTTIVGSAMMASTGAALSQNMWNHFGQNRKQPGSSSVNVVRPAKDLNLFDEASRGPEGSLQLILRRGPLSLAGLGAVVTILNTLFATFTQQLVSLETLPTPNGTAKPFPRCQQYDAVSVVDSSTKAAIIASSVQGNNAVPLQPQCATGNCTYSHHIPTMAICGSCTNVTDRLDNGGTCDWALSEDEPEGQPCVYNLPNGPSLEFLPAHSVDARPGPFAIWNATNLLGANGDGDLTVKKPDSPSLAYNDASVVYVMKFATIGLPPNVAEPVLRHSASGHGTLPKMQAQECALWFCLNSYEVSVSSGRASINLTKSTSKMSPKSTTGTSPDSLLQGPNFIDIPNDFDIYPAPRATSYAYGLGSNFAWNSMQAATAMLLPRNNSYVWGVPGLFFGGFNYGNNTENVLNLIEGVYQHSGSLHNWTLNLAAALTSSLAEVAPADNSLLPNGTDYYDGTATRSETFFKIRWEWISLPILVLMLAYVFFLLTMFQTQRKNVRPWKANPLVMLLANVDEEVRQQSVVSDDLDSVKGLGDSVAKARLGLHWRVADGLLFTTSAHRSENTSQRNIIDVTKQHGREGSVAFDR